MSAFEFCRKILSYESDEELERQVNLIMTHKKKSEMIDWIEGVTPLERWEYSFTVEDFKELCV